MRLEKYIANLLYRHECVVVPAFGAFIAEWKSAVVNENGAEFLPPRKLISFNQLIKSNDGLLVNHVAKEENTSFEAANILVNNTVVFWTEKLKNNETLSIETIGEIIENSNGNWLFKPNLQHNFLTDSFGLSSFNSPAIARNKGFVAPVFTEIEKPEPIRKIEVLKQQNDSKAIAANNTIQRRNQYLKYAASVAIVGCLGAFGYKQYNNFSFEQNQQIAIENAKKQVNKKIQEASFALPDFTESLVLEEEIKQEKNTKTENSAAIIIDLNLPYQVIAGSFQSTRRSNVLVEELKKLDYKTEISHPKMGIYRVVLASFNTEAEAEVYKNKVAENPKYKDTWVLK